MHSNERTLLSSLGFNDPDKRDRRHDLAARYLAEPERRHQVAEFVILGHTPARELDSDFIPPDEVDFRIERPIIKGSGSYRSFVGFTDLEIEANLEIYRACEGKFCGYCKRKNKANGGTHNVC